MRLPVSRQGQNDLSIVMRILFSTTVSQVSAITVPSRFSHQKVHGYVRILLINEPILGIHISELLSDSVPLILTT